ncbi:hypothetical protein Tco_0900127 [Tanacetum coccineum]
MDGPNITMEEYIRLEEEKAQKHGKVFNRETAKYGKICYDEDVFNLRSVETEFPAIVFNDNLTSNEIPSCEPTVISLNNELDFRISFDESDDEDYTVVFDKKSFSYKIISTNDLKMDSENNNEKVNKPLFPSPKPTVSCTNDLDFFKDFENEFPAIVYNDALTSKSDFSTEPTLCPQHINEFDFKDETSLSEYDEEEQNVLYFNDLFPFNIIYPDDLKLDKGNDNNEIDMIQSSGGNENTQGSNKLLEESHDKINKVFIIIFFVMELNVNIVAWNYFFKGMLFNLIKNLYVPFGIPFDPKLYYKDGDCARMLWKPRYEGLQYTDADIEDFEMRLARIYRREHRDAKGQSVFTSQSWRRLFDIRGLLVHELILEFFSTFRSEEAVLDLDTTRALYARRIPDKGDLSAYWTRISSVGDFLGTPPSYTLIKDLMLRSCHRLIACSIAGRSQAPEKVTVADLFYLIGMDVGSINIPYLLARFLRLFSSRRKQGAMISGGQFIARLTDYFGLLTKERLQGLTMIVRDLPVIDIAELEGNVGGVAGEASVAPGGGDEDEEMPQAVPPPPRTQGERISRLEGEVHGMREVLQGQREVPDSMARDFSSFTIWTITSLARLMDMAGVPYTRYSESSVEYQRRTRQRTDGANISTAPSSQTHDPSIPYLYPLTKTGSKFSTIVRGYVTEPSRLSKSRAGLRTGSVYKTSLKEKKSTMLVENLRSGNFEVLES